MSETTEIQFDPGSLPEPKNGGGPAFPSEQHETQDGKWNQTFESGLLVRDWFAGQASGEEVFEILNHIEVDLADIETAGEVAARCALARRIFADAMLAERDK